MDYNTSRARATRSVALLVAGLGIFCHCLFSVAQANEAMQKRLPTLELGIGVGGLSLPDYVGARHRQTRVFPIPYIIYRGERVKIDREGVRGDIFRSRRSRFYLSLNAGTPVSSGENAPRLGMPELDPTFEAGPAWQIYLDSSAERRWSIRLPVRAVIATDFRTTEAAGWVFTPDLHLDSRRRQSGWQYSVSVGPIYGSERYHDYYYEVASEYVTGLRPRYNAGSGFGGMRAGVTLRKRFPRFWVGLFVRHHNLSGAVYQDSPLVETRHSTMVGGGISWIFYTSDNSV